jgi:DNA-binding response OmpR family regulator
MMNRETVLMLEDDLLLLKSNAEVLEKSGYHELAFPNVKAARKALGEESPDIMVLDVKLPDGNGFDFYREYKEKYGGGTPVVFLTVMAKEEYAAQGYGIGGLDYIIKPYKADHLEKKIRSLLDSHKAAAEALVLGNLRLDCITNTAWLDGLDLLLTPKEYTVLEVLARNKNRYMTAEALYEKVWGQDMSKEDNAVRKAVSRLRKKLEGSEYTINMNRGEGYCFERA